MSPTLTFSLSSIIASATQGRMQVNLPRGTPYSSIMYLDQIKQAKYHWHNWNGSAIVANDDYTKLNSQGWPQSMPTTPATSWRLSQIWIHGAAGDQWDLEYPSDATVSLASGSGGDLVLSEATISTGLKRYTITSSTYSNGQPSLICTLQVTAMSSALTANSIRLSCYKRNGVVIDNRARLNNGEIFDPLFLEQVTSGGKAWGKIRFMDLMETNANFLRLYSNWTPHNFATSEGHYFTSSYWVGDATKGSLNTYTFPRFVGSPGSWTDGLMWSGRLTSAPTTWSATVTKGATTTVTTPVSHGLSNGDKVEVCYGPTASAANEWYTALASKQNGTGLTPLHTVTVTSGTTFTIPVDTSALSTSGVTIGMAPAVYFKDTTLGAKRAVWNTLGVSYLDREQFAINTDLAWQYDSEFDVVICQLSDPMPIQEMCALANLLESDPQFTLPWGFLDASSASFAAEVDTYLDADRTPDFSYSNEIWNSAAAFKQYYQAQSVGYKYWNTPSIPDAYGKRLVGMANAIATQLGTRAHRFTLDLHHTTNYNSQSTLDGWLQATNFSGGDPADYPGNNVHIITSAPYFYLKMDSASDADGSNYTDYQTNINLYKSGVPSSMATAIQWGVDEFWNGPSEPGSSSVRTMSEVPGQCAWMVNAISSYSGRDGGGLQYEQYEGGPHSYGSTLSTGFPTGGISTADVGNFWKAVQRSQAYADNLKLMHEQMFTAGARFTSHYMVIDPWSDSGGYWGLQEGDDWDYTRTPAWTELKAFNDDTYTPVITTDVSITYSGGNIVGSVATAVPGTFEAWPEVSSRTYQWYRDGVAIGGATSASYTFVLADDLKTITVKETAHNSLGSVTSTSSGVVVGVLYGAGTAAGNILGSETDGLAIDHATDQILIRDSTGAKNYLGTYSTLCPGDSISSTLLPWSANYPSSIVMIGTANASYPGYLVFFNFQYSATSYLRLQDAGARKNNLVSRPSSIEADISTTNAFSNGGSVKLGARWNTDNCYAILNGNSGSAVSDTGCPNAPTFGGTAEFWTYDANASLNFNGTRISVLWVPRAMTNGELLTKTS